MHREFIGYALLCVVTPLAWGFLVAWVSDRVEARLQHRAEANSERPAKPMPPIEYHI